MTLTMDTARACARAVASEHGCVIVDPADARPWLSLLEGALALIPGSAPVLASARSAVEGAASSVAGLTIPSPWGSAILLTERATADAATYLSTAMHEATHGTDAADVGAGQAVVDYANAELRALREGGPGGVGLWTRYLVTGERPKPEDAGVVASTLYHLDADSRRFGGGIVRVSLASIDTGAVPPFRVARSVLAWLRANAPAAVVAPEYAERAPEVPR